MRNRATADRQVGVWGAVGTALLHVGVVASMLFTWAHKLDFADQSTPIVPVDLVTVADKTNIAPQAPQIAPDKLAPPTLPDMLEPPPQVVPEPKIEVAPAAEKKPEKAKPAEKPKPDKFDINNIIASLNKHAPPPNSKAANRAVKGVGPQSGMTADLATMLQSEIYRCWSPPVGAPHPEKLIVSFVLLLNRDGSVAQPPQLTSESAAAASDPYMRAAAEAGRRAIYTCAPYKLPPERYSQWQSVEITFDPRMLMGQ
jgi:outer membrane biosynthesis protein TonB